MSIASFEIEIKRKAILKALTQILDERALRAVLNSASHEATKGIKPLVHTSIQKYFALESKPGKRASVEVFGNNTSATLKITGWPLPLSYFKHSPTHSSRRGDPHVTAEVEKGSVKHLHPFAFVQEMPNNKRLQIFERDFTDRFPIFVHYGAAYPDMAMKTGIRKRIENAMLKQYEAELIKHL